MNRSKLVTSMTVFAVIMMSVIMIS